jgi:lipopolysaccharide/colanic/teichoic acid biosynthesis glycosyltransferase
MPEPVTLVGVGGGLVGLMVHLARRYFETAKEVLDIVGAAAALALSAPLLAGCAVLIRLCDRGPVFYSQIRVGQGGKHFRIYKLRTMYVDAEERGGAKWAVKGDPRVLPVCRWMRRSHVDELPQLINVIKGDMSLIGPRPERPEILEELKVRYPHVNQRLAVRPGITGLAQVRNGYDTNVDAFQRKLEFDLEYVANRNWLMEITILLQTLPKFNDRTAH